MFYLLMQTTNSGDGTPLGIFDSEAIPNDQLYEYFGAYTYSKDSDFIDVRDSGIEWQLKITTNDGDSHLLTMHYFKLNEI